MSASYEQINLNSNESFYIGVFQDNIEKGTWHYHHKLELTFVTEGKGRRIVGDSIEDFYPGDLIFIGAKIPHVWIAERNEFGSETARSLESVYLQFGQDILPKEMLKLPELVHVKRALELSERGVHITGDTLNEVSSLMLELPYIDNFARMIYFYQIMNAIGKSTSNILLASAEYVARKFTSQNERITKVHEYLMSNFHEEVNLEQIAQLVHMAPGSLCRFFKSEMDMTIFDYLNKIKVDYACSLLLNRELGVADIAYDCGFNNLSHFNKQFKKNMNSTPSQYRKQFENILAG
jgi:AraC-like DNA-binding protein